MTSLNCPSYIATFSSSMRTPPKTSTKEGRQFAPLAIKTSLRQDAVPEFPGTFIIQVGGKIKEVAVMFPNIALPAGTTYDKQRKYDTR